MEIRKKEGIPRIRIEHNKKLFWIIIGLVLVLGILIFFIKTKEAENGKINLNHSENNSNKSNEEISKKCQLDSDCVPARCCHADKCINKEFKQDCEGILCSAVCSGPLDCGAGHCGCINGKCEVIPNERNN